MRRLRIAVVGGDGVGPEVTGAACQALEAVASASDLRLELTAYPAGQQALCDHGSALPEPTLDAMRAADATLLGALGPIPGGRPSPTGQLRRALDLFADVRPVRSLPGVWCLRPDIDLVCIRENTEGFLADRNLYRGSGEFMPDAATAMSFRVLTRAGCERIARFTFEYARNHGRRKVTAVHKNNVLRLGCNFFLDAVRQVAAGYPGILLEDELVDSVANRLVAAPQEFDVILATNLFGDIISDEASALVSSIVPTANLGASCAVFRPLHEALPELAGKDRVNPLSAVLSAALMLRFVGQGVAATRLEDAVKSLLAGGQVRTPDLGGTDGTSAVTATLCEIIVRGR